MQSSSQIITTNKPTSSFYRLDALPVAQPTVSKHCREDITFHGLAYTKLTWGLSILSLTTPGYLGEGCHASHQPSDASIPRFSSTNILKCDSEKLPGSCC